MYLRAFSICFLTSLSKKFLSFLRYLETISKNPQSLNSYLCALEYSAEGTVLLDTAKNSHDATAIWQTRARALGYEHGSASQVEARSDWDEAIKAPCAAFRSLMHPCASDCERQI